MKNVTNDFKTQIRTLGRQIGISVTYNTTTLTNADINTFKMYYDGAILKSVMKCVELDSNVDIELNTIIDCQAGIKVGNSYEYVDFGNFVVYSSEKKEDTNSYKIIAYDKILYSMKDYENVSYNFPMTVREYIGVVCTTLGLTFKNSSDTFANYDKTINEDMFLDAEGNFLGYTFRDVLDQLSEVVGGIICISNDDKLEIRYITSSSQTTIDKRSFKDINVNFGEKYGPVNSIVLSRSAESDNVYLRDEESVAENGLCEIKIIDNQIMNGNDRSDFLEDLLDVLDGFEYYINDYSSTGIMYLELCDRYTVSIDNNTYSCVMFNDEISIEQGLEENIYTEMPEQSETEYDKADKTDRKINQAYSMVDKQNLEITNLVSQTTQTQQLNDDRILELQERTNQVMQQITSQQATIEVMQQDIINNQQTLQNTLVTININGINVSANTSKIETLMSNDKFVIRSGERYLAFIGYDEETGQTKSEMDNLNVTNYFIAGYHRVEKITINGENRTGWFYVG